MENHIIQLENEIKVQENKITELINKLDRLEKIIQDKEKSKPKVIIMDSCKELGEQVIKKLDGIVDCLEIKNNKFGNNEINIYPTESVRKKDIFIITSGSNISGNINDNLMELTGLIRSCRAGSAKYITVICTYLPYCRSDKKDQSRNPIMAQLVCDFIKIAGANRLVTVDLHAAQIQGFFDGPFDNLYAIDSLINAIREDHLENLKDMIILSPDAGGEKRVCAWAKKLNLPYSFFTKCRDHDSISKIICQKLASEIDCQDKIALLVDDIGDTLGTLCGAAKILKDKGVKKVIAIVTHGVLSGKAFENLDQNLIDMIYVTNTIPQNENLIISNKIRVVDISNLISQSIVKCIKGESFAELFT